MRNRSDQAGSPWPTRKLGELVSEITVGFVGPMSAEYVPEGIPFLRSMNIKPFLVDTAEMMRISPMFHDRVKKSRLSAGDVVIIRTGAPGTATVIPDWLGEANCSDLVVVRPGRELDSWFLACFLNSNAKGQIDAFLVGAVQQHFNVGSARDLKIPLPRIAEQRKIARVFRSIQEKIDLNCRMNHTLENIASALFKSWFVDFDPVVAKAAGRKPFGMDDATARLFPSAFEESPLGPAPKGWEISTIGSETRVVGGSTPRTDTPEFWNNGEYCWVTPRDLSKLADPVVIDSERKITKAGLEQISSGLLSEGTVLLSSRAPIGYLAIADVSLAVNQGFIAMECDGRLPNQYVFNWCRENMDEIVSRAGGTTFEEISKQNFRPITVVVPPSDVISVFQDAAKVWHEQVVANVRETHALQTTRDTLLPKLLSGELRLDAAEKRVAELL